MGTATVRRRGLVGRAAAALLCLAVPLQVAAAVPRVALRGFWIGADEAILANPATMAAHSLRTGVQVASGEELGVLDAQGTGAVWGFQEIPLARTRWRLEGGRSTERLGLNWQGGHVVGWQASAQSAMLTGVTSCGGRLDAGVTAQVRASGLTGGALGARLQPHPEWVLEAVVDLRRSRRQLEASLRDEQIGTLLAAAQIAWEVAARRKGERHLLSFRAGGGDIGEGHIAGHEGYVLRPEGTWRVVRAAYGWQVTGALQFEMAGRLRRLRGSGEAGGPERDFARARVSGASLLGGGDWTARGNARARTSLLGVEASRRRDAWDLRLTADWVRVRTHLDGVARERRPFDLASYFFPRTSELTEYLDADLADVAVRVTGRRGAWQLRYSLHQLVPLRVRHSSASHPGDAGNGRRHALAVIFSPGRSWEQAHGRISNLIGENKP